MGCRTTYRSSGTYLHLLLLLRPPPLLPHLRSVLRRPLHRRTVLGIWVHRPISRRARVVCPQLILALSPVQSQASHRSRGRQAPGTRPALAQRHLAAVRQVRRVCWVRLRSLQMMMRLYQRRVAESSHLVRIGEVPAVLSLMVGRRGARRLLPRVRYILLVIPSGHRTLSGILRPPSFRMLLLLTTLRLHLTAVVECILTIFSVTHFISHLTCNDSY